MGRICLSVEMQHASRFITIEFFSDITLYNVTYGVNASFGLTFPVRRLPIKWMVWVLVFFQYRHITIDGFIVIVTVYGRQGTSSSDVQKFAQPSSTWGWHDHGTWSSKLCHCSAWTKLTHSRGIVPGDAGRKKMTSLCSWVLAGSAVFRLAYAAHDDILCELASGTPGTTVGLSPGTANDTFCGRLHLLSRRR